MMVLYLFHFYCFRAKISISLNTVIGIIFFKYLVFSTENISFIPTQCRFNETMDHCQREPAIPAWLTTWKHH